MRSAANVTKDDANKLKKNKPVDKAELERRSRVVQRAFESYIFSLIKKHPELKAEIEQNKEKQLKRMENLIKHENCVIENETVVLAQSCDLKNPALVLAQSGKPEEREKIKEQLSPALKAYIKIEEIMQVVIKRLCRSYIKNFPELTNDLSSELMEEGYLAFLVAFRQYNAETGINFYGYASSVIQRYLYDFMFRHMYPDNADIKLCQICHKYTKLVEMNPTITIEEIAEKLEITPKYAKRIAELVQQRYDLYGCGNNTKDDDDDDGSNRSTKTIARICDRYNMPVAAQSAEDVYMDSHDTTDDILSNIKDDKERAIFADFAGCNNDGNTYSFRMLEAKYGYGRDKIAKIIKRNQIKLQKAVNM